MNEFDLIQRYFAFSDPSGALAVGVGDDCAIVNIRPGYQLAVTTDTLVPDVHFPADGDPYLIARRALRVNLSDLAAMGASPLGFQLALTLPESDSRWLEAFGRGLAEDARLFRCPLTGGDTTRGPLTISLTMLGQVPDGKAVLRSTAGVGDGIYVTGTLGDGAGGLACLQGRGSNDYLLSRYWTPQPRLAMAGLLREFASAALDISDGLLQDVGHIANGSGLTALIESRHIPLSDALRGLCRDESRLLSWALSGGDDYEICFTVPASREKSMARAFERDNTGVNRIGTMVAVGGARPEVVCNDAFGSPVTVGETGYDHFR